MGHFMKFFRGASVVALLMILFMGAGGLLVGCSGGDNTPEVPESPDPRKNFIKCPIQK